MLVWELAGIPFIVTIGSALHFAFEWSGFWTPLALFAAVNESTWEHLKLAFWPCLFWAILECRRIDVDQDLFWAAKGYGLLIPPIVIVTVFSSYTAILEYNILAVDISIFILAVALGQIVSARQLTRSRLPFGRMLLTLQILAYATLTFVPPSVPLFQDPRTGDYGIPSKLVPM